MKANLRYCKLIIVKIWLHSSGCWFLNTVEMVGVGHVRRWGGEQGGGSTGRDAKPMNRIPS